jgi:hypothetical protein
MTDTRTPLPSDFAAHLRTIAAQQRRVASWNEQLAVVVDTILTANAAGRGVMISVSYADAKIVALSSNVLEPGQAVIFDRDSDSPRPIHRTIRTEHLTRSTS